MATKNAKRYIGIGVSKLGQGAALTAFSAAVAVQYYQRKSLKSALEHDNVSLAQIDQKLEWVFGSSNIGEKCAPFKTHALTQQNTDLKNYIACTREEANGLTTTPLMIFSLYLLGKGLKSIWRSVTYFDYAAKVRKGDHVVNFGTADQSETPSTPEPSRAFTIHNGPAPYASILLDPGQYAYSERGGMLGKSAAISMEIEVTGKGKSLASKIGNIASGEGLSIMKYQNNGQKPEELIVSANSNHQLTNIDLGQEKHILCDNGAFFASSEPVNIGLARVKSISLAAFSGQGLTMQSISASAGKGNILLSSAGQTYERALEDGEVLQIQKGSLLAFSGSVSLKIEEIEGTLTRLAGGEDPFMTSAIGPGKVWLTTGRHEHKKSGVFDMIKRMIPG